MQNNMGLFLQNDVISKSTKISFEIVKTVLDIRNMPNNREKRNEIKKKKKWKL